MTRINAGIPVEKLSHKHLLAEHREIKRLPNHLAKYGMTSEKWLATPKDFVLGKGHVNFFILRGEYTFIRYKQLHRECLRRGFKVQDYSSAWDIYKSNELCYNKYIPTKECIRLVTARIKERS